MSPAVSYIGRANVQCFCACESRLSNPLEQESRLAYMIVWYQAAIPRGRHSQRPSLYS